MFNEYPYTSYEKINLDWLLDLGKKLKEDAESGAFDGERGPGIFGITTIYQENNQYYAINPGDVTVGDFILGYSSAAGTNILYIMKVTSVTGNYVNGTSITRITGPQGPQGQQGEPGEGGLTEAMKQAFLQMARKVVYVDAQGQSYYQALYNAFYPPADLSSISAIYTQSGTVYDTDTLNSLKSDLVVTAYYSDSSSRTVPANAYTLSGTLTAGTSIITVNYDGKTTTFNVTVSEESHLEFVSGQVNLSLATSNVITRDGTIYTIVWNSDYTGTKNWQNSRIYLRYPIEAGKTYLINLHADSKYYIHETASDSLVNNGGTLVNPIHSGSEDVTFTATKTGTLIRFAFTNLPTTLNNPSITEVSE